MDKTTSVDLERLLFDRTSTADTFSEWALKKQFNRYPHEYCLKIPLVCILLSVIVDNSAV